MPVNPLVMAGGERLLLEGLVVDWEPTFSDTQPPSVVLTASVQVGPNPPISQMWGPKATTLAVQMDARVAMILYGKLQLLGRNMGWLPTTED